MRFSSPLCCRAHAPTPTGPAYVLLRASKRSRRARSSKTSATEDAKNRLFQRSSVASGKPWFERAFSAHQHFSHLSPRKSWQYSLKQIVQGSACWGTGKGLYCLAVKRTEVRTSLCSFTSPRLLEHVDGIIPCVSKLWPKTAADGEPANRAVRLTSVTRTNKRQMAIDCSRINLFGHGLSHFTFLIVLGSC